MPVSAEGQQEATALSGANAVSEVQVYEVPVDECVAGLMRAFEISVPTEDGRWCVVDVMQNLVRDTYEVEWSAALMDQAPQAITVTVQLVMLAIQQQRAGLLPLHRGRPTLSDRPLSGEHGAPACGAHGPESPPVTGPARTVGVSDRTIQPDPDVP